MRRFGPALVFALACWGSAALADTIDINGVARTYTVQLPDNKPAPEELANCRPFLERELAALTDLRVVVALGKIAFDTYLNLLKARGAIESRTAFVFGHDREFVTGEGLPALVSSYHPSQQNTLTGKLTEQMLLDVFRRARRLGGYEPDGGLKHQSQ